jgi:ribosomal protein S18 acetylase RimI-like enzyme
MPDSTTLGPDLALHRVRPDEIALLTRLQRAAYAPWIPVLGLEPLPYRADYAALLRDHEAWLARDAAGAEIGALILAVPGDHLLIWSVAVAEAAGRRGIGRALIAFAEAEAARRKLGEVRLYTNVLMTRNIALYQRLGYGETHRETTPDGRRVVHMSKRVGSYI